MLYCITMCKSVLVLDCYAGIILHETIQTNMFVFLEIRFIRTGGLACLSISSFHW